MVKKVTYEELAKYFSGNCSGEEKLWVENWRDTNSTNLAEFNQYRAIWENAGTRVNNFTPNVEQALNSVNHSLTAKFDEKPVISLPWISYTRRIAAAILIGVGLWMTYYLINKNDKEVQMVAESGNGQTKVALADGTFVWLNAKSTLNYPLKFKGKTRTVQLEGEAYFEVAKNAAMPFIIETNHSVVKVLGTRFNLRARKTELATIISVTEGKVSFTGKDAPNVKPVLLLAGDKGLYNLAAHEIILEKTHDPNFLAWKTGKLVFKNTPLGKVASDISDYFNQQVTVDSAKANIPFTGAFDKQSLNDVLLILEVSLKVKTDSANHAILLK